MEPSPELELRYKHDTKLMPCKYCEVPIRVGIRTRKAPRHIDCAIKAAVDAQFQMARKSGPYYERWLNSAGPKGRPKSRTSPFDEAT